MYSLHHQLYKWVTFFELCNSLYYCTICNQKYPNIFARIHSLHHRLYKWVTFFELCNNLLSSNRKEELLPPSLPRTHLAVFTAVRSNLSLPTCQGALKERINRCLSCQNVTMSLAEVFCIEEWISHQLYQNMSPDFCIREPSKCGRKGCENPIRIID